MENKLPIRRRSTNRSFSIKLKKYIPIYIMGLPGLLYLFINNYMPLPGLILAFKNYNARAGIYGSPWAGLANFKYLFSNDVWYITRNTMLYNVSFIVINMVLAITIAIILSEMQSKAEVRARKVYQSLILLPFLLSSVIVSYLVFAFLSTDNGFFNKSILRLLGQEPISWYSERKYWPFLIVFVNAWKGVGYSCVIFLATILGFDKSYYEAAVIDGASKMQQIFYITIPMLKNIVVMIALLQIGRIMYSDFGLFYQVPRNSGALFPVTNTIDTYVYRGLVELGSIKMSAAAGVYQSLVGFILILGTNLLVRKIDPDSALF